MLSLGIDTHERINYAEIQDDKANILWHGRFNNAKKDFEELIDRIDRIEKSNNNKIMGIFINPTGNYHLPLRYFLEKHGFNVYMIDSRKTVYLRMVMNLNTEKSDKEDAHILASTPWFDHNYNSNSNHDRLPLSNITRERNIINKNITRLTNIIHSDLAAVFPEFIDVFSIDSATGMAILGKYAAPLAILNAGKNNIIKLIKKASRNHYNSDTADKLIALAKNSIGIPDDGIYEFRIRMNIRRLKNELNELKAIDNEIIKRATDNDDIDHLIALKGIGTINSAVIVSEIGDIKQFDSVLKLQSYAGKCPDMTGSGGKSYSKGVTHVRNKYLGNAVYESAVSLVMNKNGEFYNVFNREIGKKKSTVEAYIAVAKRLSFHVYSIMKNNKPYKERKVGNMKVS